MPSLSPRRPLVLLALIVVMAAIFLIDTVTDYAVAAACFYAAVILAASRVLSARGLITLAIACIALTGLSFFLTRFGTYRIGLVNSVIGMLVIGITTYLALNMEAAKAAVQEAQGRLLRVARASTVGELTTSIETMMHIGVYKARRKVNAVIHTHPILLPPTVTSSAIVRLSIGITGALKTARTASRN